MGSAIIRGFAPASGPVYAIADAPGPWKEIPSWAPWMPVAPTRGMYFGRRRALLSPNGARIPGATPRYWQTFSAAIALAENLALGARRGGVCYVLSPTEDGEYYGAVFFAISPPDRPGRAVAVFQDPGADS